MRARPRRAAAMRIAAAFTLLALCAAAAGCRPPPPAAPRGDARGDARPAHVDDLDRPLAFSPPDPVRTAGAIFAETNARRAAAGLPPLLPAEALDRAARLHAESMARHGFFDHQNPVDPRLRTLEDRVRAAGFGPWSLLAENLATGHRLQLRPGTPFYPTAAGPAYSPDGPPIPPHTYRSFAARLLDGWMASPGHRANILDPRLRLLGCGCAPRTGAAGLEELVCAQVFAAPR